MTKKQKELAEIAKAKLQAEINNSDTEAAHGNADNILCEFLKQIGFGELVKIYEKVDKWYA